MKTISSEINQYLLEQKEYLILLSCERDLIPIEAKNLKILQIFLGGSTKYCIKLKSPHTALPTQIKDGFLCNDFDSQKIGEIMLYDMWQARKKARMFDGDIKKWNTSFNNPAISTQSFLGKKYVTREVAAKGGHIYLIGSDALLPDGANYVSKDAENIDKKFYGYAPENIIHTSTAKEFKDWCKKNLDLE